MQESWAPSLSSADCFSSANHSSYFRTGKLAAKLTLHAIATLKGGPLVIAILDTQFCFRKRNEPYHPLEIARLQAAEKGESHDTQKFAYFPPFLCPPVSPCHHQDCEIPYTTSRFYKAFYSCCPFLPFPQVSFFFLTLPSGSSFSTPFSLCTSSLAFEHLASLLPWVFSPFFSLL